MIGDFFRRLVNGAVMLLAALTFFLVPIGRKTGAQHLVAIFSTPPAHEAAEAVAGAARKLTAVVAAEMAKIRRTAELESRKRAEPAGN